MQYTLVIKLSLISLCLKFLMSCQVPPDVKDLQDENARLQTQLSGANHEIAELTEDKRSLQADVEELNRVMGVLGNEKSSRVKESSSLRLQIRRFVQKQIDDLKDFMVRGNLLDYIGGELVSRAHVTKRSLVLVDFANKVPRKGTLTGLAGHFTGPASVMVNVLRPVNGRYVVIWQSQLLTVRKKGEARLRFPISVGVEKNDVVAYAFPEVTSVSYDRGTGNTLYTSKSFNLGNMISKSELSGQKEKRAYSLGVFAILD